MLGPFATWRGRDAIPDEAWRTRPTLALFKFLLDQRDRFVPVEQLIEAIWPEAKPRAARQSLQVAIRTIRLVLEPDLDRGADSQFVRTRPGGYIFDARDCSIDVDHFLAASQRALSVSRVDIAAALSACREAAAIYRGEYLADDPYLEWAFGKRESLQARYLDVLDLLSASLLDTGDVEEAIKWLETAIELDPLREELHRRLMVSYARRGQRSQAISVFERCRDVLSAELGVEPAAETQALLAKLERDRSGTVGLLADDRIAPAGPSRLQLPFVGRGPELSILDRAGQRATVEAGAFVALSGPSGVGKTRLLEEFRREIVTGRTQQHTASGDVLWIRCHETEKTVPFAPLIRQLTSWMDREATDADRSKLAAYAPALDGLIPQTGGTNGDDGRTGPPVETAQVLEAISGALRVMLRGPLTAVIVDDAQWADSGLLLWLGYTLHADEPGILTIASYRTGEPLDMRLQQLLDEGRRNGRLVDLHLAPLSVGAIDDLLASGLRDNERRADLSRRLYQDTGGLPLFVVEVLRDMFDAGRLYLDMDGWWGVDQSDETGNARVAASGVALQEIIRSRITRVTLQASDVFTALCVVGGDSSAQLLATVNRLSLESTLGALDQLLDCDLIQIAADGSSYVVGHPLVRETIYESLSLPVRQRLHLRIAAALSSEANERNALPAQELHHLAAGAAPTLDVVRAAERAGDFALRSAAVSDAIAFYQQALDRLQPLLPEPSVRTLYARIRESLAGGLAAGGSWESAVAAYEAIHATGEEPVGRARALRKVAGVLGDIPGRFEQALDALDQSERELENAFASSSAGQVVIEHGHIESIRANIFFYQSEYQLAITHGERAIAHWNSGSGLERYEADQLVRIGNAEQRLGLLDRAGRRYRAALARSEMLGDPALGMRCRDMLGGLYSVQGRFAEAEQIHKETAAFGREFGMPRLEIIGLANAAVALANGGRLGEAREAYEQVLHRAEALDARYTVMHVLVGLGEVLVRIGDAEYARESLQRGIELSHSIRSPQRRGHALLHLAELELLERRHEDALELASCGIETGATIRDIHAQREGLPLLSRALTGLGRIEEALNAARRGLEISENGGFRLSQARNLLALGEARALQGHLPGAMKIFRETAGVARDIGARYDLARTLAATARYEPDERARDVLLVEARDLAIAAPSRWIAEEVERLFDR